MRREAPPLEFASLIRKWVGGGHPVPPHASANGFQVVALGSLLPALPFAAFATGAPRASDSAQYRGSRRARASKGRAGRRDIGPRAASTFVASRHRQRGAG